MQKNIAFTTRSTERFISQKQNPSSKVNSGATRNSFSCCNRSSRVSGQLASQRFIESRVLSLSDSQCKKSRVRKGLANHLPGMTMGWLSGEVSAVTVETWMYFSSMFRCYLFSSEDLKPLVFLSGYKSSKGGKCQQHGHGHGVHWQNVPETSAGNSPGGSPWLAFPHRFCCCDQVYHNRLWTKQKS